MKNIDYFKLCAKNLHRDYTAEFGPKSPEDCSGRSCARFFDIDAIAMEYDLNPDDELTLMQAQHVIAKMVGMHSWADLINQSDSEIARLRQMLDLSPYKLTPRRVYAIDIDRFPRIGNAGPMGDYLVQCDKTPELTEIITMTPNCLFLSTIVDDALRSKIDTDTEHLYVNVCPGHEIRVHVPGTDWHTWHAVEIKNV